MRHFAKYDLIPLLSMVLVCAFPCVFLYAQNADEVSASSMLPFFIVFLVNSAAFFLLLSCFFRNVSRAAFFTDLLMLVVINFCFVCVHIKRVLPFFRDRYLLVLLGVLFLLLFVWFLRKKPDLRVGCALMLLAFGAVTVMNGAMAIPAMARAHEVREEVGQPREETGVVFGENRPNVYLYLFDEYGGYHNLMQYYDYDNSDFLGRLSDLGFTVALESRNTEAVNTDTIVPNLLNLDYVVSVEDHGREKKAYRDNTFLTRMFRENGYQVNLVNHVDYLGVSGCRVLTEHQTRRTISEFLMRNSIYNKSFYLRYLLEQFFVMDYGANYRSSLDDAMEKGLNCYKETGDQPTLTIVYIQCPHSPTMVGRHGEALSYADGWNWNKPELYLDQVGFISDYILEVVETLQENDPGALIYLGSDHGNRYPLHMMQMGNIESYDPHEENPYIQNVLSCVYYGGEAFDIEGQTGINTLRRVFNQVLGTNFTYVEPVYDFSTNAEDEKQ